jgi:AraC-like DNA-binding protein
MGGNVHTNMFRASKIFVFEERPSESPFIEKFWRTRSEPFASFISIAASHWEIVVTRHKDRIHLTVRGPETRATNSPIPQNAEFFGIQFTPGAFMPSLPVTQLVDASLTLREATGQSFWLNGSAWEFPDYDNADIFVNKLVRKGLLVRDPIVEAALQGQPAHLCLRSVQRRVLRATGLTPVAIRQMERATKAVELLERGATILDTVERTGYADQSHLTRSVKRFFGQTPLQIVRERV